MIDIPDLEPVEFEEKQPEYDGCGYDGYND